jgi:geranylgeranyl diphosphate synthase type I
MIENELVKRATLVSSDINKFLPTKYPSMLYEASRYLLNHQGKRIRSSTLLLAGESLGGDPMNLIPAAIAVELIHNYTLIHDDIIDNAMIRHKKPTVHEKWTVPRAILAGDTLNSKAFEILNLVKADSDLKSAAIDVLAKACTTISEGQWLDLDLMDNEKASEKDYLEMIEKKTGALLGASASLGAILSGGTARAIEGLEKFGRLTGMAFQLYDDILDITTPEEILGKRQGGDIIEGKRTLIIIHALNHGINVDFLGKKDLTLQEINKIRSILEDCGSIDYSKAKASEFAEKGKQTLDALPESNAKSILLDLTDYNISRKY